MDNSKITKQTPALTSEALDNMPAIELKEQRWRFGKVFSMEGGNRQAVTYADPVHYHNAGTNAWEEIDNTFVQDQYEGNECLRNKANSLQVICARSGKQPFLHLTDEDGNKISYGVKGAAEICPQPDADESQSTADGGNTVLARREKILQTQDATARYAGIFPDAPRYPAA